MKHKHAEVIKAWVEDMDTPMQFWNEELKGWLDVVGSPLFNTQLEYRIKPEPPAKVYPETGMTPDELYEIWRQPAVPTGAMTNVANAVLRHAIDNDQVVPMAEVLTMARALRPRERAARDMVIAKAVQDALAQAIFAGRTGDFGPAKGFDLAAIIASVKD